MILLVAYRAHAAFGPIVHLEQKAKMLGRSFLFRDLRPSGEVHGLQISNESR